MLKSLFNSDKQATIEDQPDQGKRIIYLLAAVAAILATLGIVNLYSATQGSGIFYNQLVYLALGFALIMLIGFILPLNMFNTYTHVFFATICFALILVILIGDSAGGAQRWLAIGSLRWQPSEMAKLAVILFVAKYFNDHQSSREYTLLGLWRPMAILAIPFLFIFMQPDLGTAGVCLLIAAAQLSFLRINLKSIAWATGGGLIAISLLWNFGLRAYQKQRVMTLLDPTADPTGTGYNALQSQVAVGGGQFWGKGFLQGTQTHLRFLPARHTDFIFSVYSEEHGFIMAFVLFALFCLLTLLALEIARRAKDTFSAMLAIGIAAFIFIEFFINIAMVLGLFPVVGVPLPFFSYGGTAMIMICIMIGLLIAIERDSQSKDAVFKVLG